MVGLAYCRRWLLPPEILKEAHTKDIAKGLTAEQVHLIKIFMVQCECPLQALSALKIQLFRRLKSCI